MVAQQSHRPILTSGLVDRASMSNRHSSLSNWSHAIPKCTSARCRLLYSGEMTAEHSFRKVDGCDLCAAPRITPWYHQDDICWIAECDICEVPMVVWRFHGTDPPIEHLTHMHERIRRIAVDRLGEFYLDDHMRNIPDHYHAHARPKGGFFGRDARRRPGLGTA